MFIQPDVTKGTLSFPESYHSELTIMRKVGIQTENIKIKDRIGLWYIADIACIHYITTDHRSFYYLSLLEHQTFGDTAGHLLAYFNWNTSTWVELTETWDSIEETAAYLDLV